MNSLRKIILSIFLIILLTTSIFSIDFGGTIVNSSGITGEFDNLGLDQNDKATLWLKIPFDESQNTYLAAEGSYTFTYDGTIEQKTNQIDLGMFKIGMLIPLSSSSKFRFDFGRVSGSDISGLVYSQYSDGLQFSLTSTNFSMSAIASYTGLLNAHTSTYYGFDYTYDSEIVYPLAPKFVISGLTFSFPALFANQTLNAEAYGFWDIDDQNDFDYNRIYGTLGLNGGISGNLYYVLTSTFGYSFGNEAVEGLSNLTKLELSMYPTFLSSSFTVSAVYASGNSEDGLKAFIPFNKITADTSGNKVYSGLFKTGLTATLQPNKKFLLSAGADFLCNIQPDADESFAADGLQWTFNARWQIFSDLQLSLSTGQYVPVADSVSPDDFFANIRLVISF